MIFLRFPLGMVGMKIAEDYNNKLRTQGGVKMKRKGPGVLLVLALVLAVAVLAPGPAQTAAPSQDAGQKPIRIDVNVTLKLIQVAVTDRKGKPVMDLTPADFAVTDNGKAVVITQFEKHQYGGSDAPLPSGDVAPILPRKFFLIFDLAFMDQNGLLRAKHSALHFLDAIVHTGDEVGLISYSPTKNLVLHEYLTTDHKKIRQLVESFGLRSVSGRAESLFDFYLDQMRADIDETLAHRGTAPETQLSDTSLTELLRSRVQTVLGEGQKAGYVQQVVQFSRAFKNLALSLRYAAGTKHILFFSNGIARKVLYGGKLAVTDWENWGSADELAKGLAAYDDSMPESVIRDSYAEMLDEFKAANCQIYSFNEARVRGEVGIDDAQGTAAASKDMLGDDALRQLASATGGKYYHNTIDFRKAMEDVSSLTNAFYVLGYSVDEKWDGAFHKVKVKVARKGTNVQAQAGYYNLKPFDKLTGFEKMLQLMDLALGETSQYCLPAEIPLAAVPVRAGMVNLFAGHAMLSAETFKGVLGKNAEAFVFIFDDQRNVISIKRFLLPPPLDRDGLLVDFALIVRPGAYQGRIVIRNPQTGRGARGQAAFMMPDAAAVGAWSDPLLLLEEGRNTLAVNATGDLSLPKLYGYDSVKFFPRSGDIPTGVPRITAAIRCGGFGDGQDLTFVASALNSATQVRTPVAVTVLEKSQSGGANLLRLDLGIGELAPGTYSMDVVIQSKNAGINVMASTSLKISGGID
jgi:VWFA-related protein